jgi:hypothetical protein
MQLLSCYISIAGDDDQIVVREHDSAVTFPEMLILKALHGGDSVRNIKDAGEVERDSDEERQRLIALYGYEIVKQVFPGEHTALPEHDARMKRERAKEKEAETPDVLRAEEPETSETEETVKPAANRRTK